MNTVLLNRKLVKVAGSSLATTKWYENQRVRLLTRRRLPDSEDWWGLGNGSVVGSHVQIGHVSRRANWLRYCQGLTSPWGEDFIFAWVMDEYYCLAAAYVRLLRKKAVLHLLSSCCPQMDLWRNENFIIFYFALCQRYPEKHEACLSLFIFEVLINFVAFYLIFNSLNSKDSWGLL